MKVGLEGGGQQGWTGEKRGRQWDLRWVGHSPEAALATLGTWTLFWEQWGASVQSSEQSSQGLWPQGS